MPVPFQRPRALMLLLALTAAALLLAATSAMASPAGALYTQTNDPAGNSVQRFIRGADGSLTGYAGGLPRKERLLQHEGVLLGPVNAIGGLA